MGKDDGYTLHSDRLTAIIAPDGAELISLKDTQGLELLWQAGPAWPRHAPILFPIVGKLKNDTLRHRGNVFPMTQHGFARDRRFDWADRGPASCTLVLTDDAATRSHYPFAFRLAVTYAVNGPDLDVAFEVTNTGDEILPASIGGHPAFNWPLLPELGKEDYRMHFSSDERAPVRRLEDGLLRAVPEPNPIRGKTLALSEQLFEDDAIILDQPASASVRYAADRGPSSKLGSPLLCIEPWHGFASPADFDGEFSDKPGVMHIAPGAKRSLSYRIRVG